MSSLSAVTEIDFDWPRRFWASLSKNDQNNLIKWEFFFIQEASADLLVIIVAMSLAISEKPRVSL